MGTHWTESSLCNDDGFFSFSSTEQKRVEDDVLDVLRGVKSSGAKISFHRDLHKEYIMRGIKGPLATSYASLDASRPWLCYWILHSAELMNLVVPDENKKGFVRFLKSCEGLFGGYSGGPGQLPHLAPTYAAVMALAVIGTEEAFKSLDRIKLRSFLQKVRQPDGSFQMHEGGEVDIRAAYCAVTVATLVSLPDRESLFENTAQYLRSCQTYEGGFGAEPGAEAHGGYTFCGVAALILLGHDRLIDAESLLRWLAQKQARFEGGFQGRTNKLVDACYSFWQGATFPLVQSIFERTGTAVAQPTVLCDAEALRDYLLACCQGKNGGLLDKPGKSPDYYHTCYALSGLATLQSGAGAQPAPPKNGLNTTPTGGGVGDREVLEKNHPLLNISFEAEQRMRQFFANLTK